MVALAERKTARSVGEKMVKGVLSYRWLDPVVTPIYRRWDKSLALGDDVSIRGRGAIRGHLSSIYWECVRSRPQLVVELGVRGGDSTVVFCEAGKLYDGKIVSVDINPAPFDTGYEGWHFLQGRSQDVGKKFAEVRADLGLGLVDILFVDSSHLYEETVEELKSWLPHLSPGGTIMCHDTCMGRVYRATNGGLRRGWDNKRGVTRALEEVLGLTLEERVNHVKLENGWVVNHNPLSSGFTMLTRIAHLGGPQE